MLGLAALLGSASAATVRLRPQNPQIEQIIADVLKRISSEGLPLTLDKSSGTILALGGSGATARVAFNPDVSARTLNTADGKRIEFNPKGPQPLKDAVEAELLKELGLSALTPEAARLRFSGVDINGDGKVDTADLALLMGSYGQSGSNQRGDLNNDGHVDDLDLQIFSKAYRLP